MLQVCGYTHECHTTTTTANNNNNGSPHTTTTYTTTNNVDHNSRIGGAHVHRDNKDEMCACATAEEARSDEFAYEAVFFLPSTQSVGVPGACASSVPVARLPLTPRLLEDPAQVTFYRRYLVRTQSRVATMANNAEDYATFTNHLDGYDSVPLSSAHAAHTDMTNTHSTHACHTSDSDATTCGDSASATASSCGYLTMTLAHISTTAKYAVDLTLLLLPYRRTHTSSSSAAALSASAAYYRVPFHPERTPVIVHCTKSPSPLTHTPTFSPAIAHCSTPPHAPWCRSNRCPTDARRTAECGRCGRPTRPGADGLGTCAAPLRARHQLRRL